MLTGSDQPGIHTLDCFIYSRGSPIFSPGEGIQRLPLHGQSVLDLQPVCESRGTRQDWVEILRMFSSHFPFVVKRSSDNCALAPQIVYCAWLAFELVYLYFTVIETKNLPLESIAALFDGEDVAQELARAHETHEVGIMEKPEVEAPEKADPDV
jgi:hypothetical protein